MVDTSRNVMVAPSILSADMADLARDLGRIATADLVHVDVMDGRFVPNLSYGTPIVKAARSATDLPLDVHLMVSNPDETVAWYVDAGADMVTFHAEASTHMHRTVHLLRERGVRAGVALNPSTPVDVLSEIVADVDMVLLRSVDPGFGGHSLIEGTLGKLGRPKRLCDARGAAPMIEVDGGISAGNAEAVARAGANVLVAGSAVFGSDDPSAAIAGIRAAAERGAAAREA